MCNLPRAFVKGYKGHSIGRSSGGGVVAVELAGVRVWATPGLGSEVKRLGVLAQGSSKLGQGLRGVLLHNSELATVRPRLRMAASRWS